MIEAACHCGAVRIRAPVPAQISECNCSICRKLGSRWAYYSPAEVSIAGSTAPYIHGDRTLATHHCPTCGCTTHWLGLDAYADRVAVNARLMSGVENVPVRHFDGADTWTFLD